MRGEDSKWASTVFATGGSPPHARGRRRLARQPAEDHRITPACAGKTLRAARRQCGSPDHPRMRGEDPSLEAEAEFKRGSPPHARGRLDGEVKEPKSFRITPACAGKTRPDSGGHCCHWDHPRMRGEDGHVCHTFPHVAGSPPHARGRRHEPPSRARSTGITPACAGKTVKVRPPGLLLLGSPPHARGRHRVRRTACPAIRITPACAGKTMWSSQALMDYWDHPRMRGEDTIRAAQQHYGQGSPPHARGRRPISGPPCPIVMDHPRMRGEDEFTGIIDKMGKGSPPHARGRHIRV